MPGAPEPSGRQLNQDEEQLLVWKIRTRKCLKKIHPQNGCPKSIFKPVESDQFQIGTHRVGGPRILTLVSANPIRRENRRLRTHWARRKSDANPQRRETPIASTPAIDLLRH